MRWSAVTASNSLEGVEVPEYYRSLPPRLLAVRNSLEGVEVVFKEAYRVIRVTSG